MTKREWLTLKRKEANLTLKALANIVGCSETHIWEIEKGRKNPSLKLAFNIANELNFDMKNFFHETVEL